MKWRERISTILFCLAPGRRRRWRKREKFLAKANSQRSLLPFQESEGKKLLHPLYEKKKSQKTLSQFFVAILRFKIDFFLIT